MKSHHCHIHSAGSTEYAWPCPRRCAMSWEKGHKGPFRLGSRTACHVLTGPREWIWSASVCCGLPDGSPAVPYTFPQVTPFWNLQSP